MDPVERYLQRIEERYRRIAAQIEPSELQADPAEPHDFTDLIGPGAGTQLFVGYYSLLGLRRAVGRYGLLRKMAEAAWCQESDLHLSFDMSDSYHHVLRVHNGLARPETLLLELRVHLRDQPIEGRVPGALGYVSCEWLLLQNPARNFSPERPRLPGQRMPGLGVGAEVQTLLAILTRRIGRHGLLAYPAFCHTAAMYTRRFHLLDPAAEGRLQALLRDGAALPLDVLSWAVELGCVRTLAGEPYAWEAHEEMLPVSKPTRAYFVTEAYAAARDSAMASARYVFDLPLLEARRPLAEAEAELLSLRAYEAAQRAHDARHP